MKDEISTLAGCRALLAADDPSKLPHVHTFSESSIGNLAQQIEFEGRRFGRFFLNYLVGLILLKNIWLDPSLTPPFWKSVAESVHWGALLFSGTEGMCYWDKDCEGWRQ